MRKQVLMKGVLLAGLFMFVSMTPPAMAQEIVINEKGEIIQHTGQGDINWSRGIISAVGYADPNQPIYAQQVAAAADARANLLTVLGDMHIKRGITVEKGKLTRDINIQTIEGVLRGSFLGEPKRASNGMLSVIAYKHISSDLISTLMPARYFAPEPGEAVYKPAPAAMQTPEKPQEQSYTGLIIDAKGLDVVPSLGFRVLVEDSKEVLYGLSTVDRISVISKRGMAGYASSIEDAKKNPRVGKTPMVVKAVRSGGESNTDLYISKQDAAKIYNANLNTSFLKDLKVVIVCGSKA